MRRLDPGEWRILRRLRLELLSCDPEAFGSTHAAEAAMSDDEWMARAARATGAQGATFVAVDDAAGEPVGIVTGYRPDLAVNETEMVSMWTAPAARGRGTGAALVDALVGWASQEGFDAVNLWVMRGNEVAARLYQRHGFVEHTSYVARPGDPCEHELRMRLDLQGST